MKIFRATDTKALNIIYDNLIEDSYNTKDVQLKEYATAMVVNPASICVALIITDDMQLAGFGVCRRYNSDNYVWLANAWTDSKLCEHKDAVMCLDVIKKWAIDTYNINEIRAETKRSDKAILKSWGFEIISWTMGKKF
jgi:hypothetical protein